MSQVGIIKNSVTADIGAPELAAIFKGIITTNGIVKQFSDLACARVNDNLVRLSAGVYNLSGYLLAVKQGTTEDLVVDSGTAGYNRKDLVIAEFIRNGGGAGIDTLAFRVLKGTPTTGTAVDPTLTQDDINGTGVTRQEALYRLVLTGTTLETPTLMASVVGAGAPLDSPTFTTLVTLPPAVNTTGVMSEKCGSDSFAISTSSKVVTDSFITADTYISIFPMGTKVGEWSVVSSAGSFTITSTKTETAAVAFKWKAMK